MKSESVIGETALVTGALGQDGHYITRQLKRQGFRVFGTTKHNVTPHDGISYLTCDSTSPSDVNLLFDLVHPDLIFHLSGKTNDYETGVQEENNKGLDTILEATRKHSPQSRFFFAGSAFMFGRPTTVPQIETTPPNSAREYGRSKTYGFRRVAEARKAGLFACTGILYNHISPHCSKKKAPTMVARSAVSAASGNSEILRMQTFHSRRDWGHAEEYTDAMIRMLELDEPQDLLLASGTTHSLKELISVAYRTAGQPLEWSGEGVDECAHNETGRKLVAIDKEHYNPDPRQNLVGDASLAYKVLNGWETRTPFEDIITEIVEHHLDLNHATSQRYTRS